MAFSAGFLFCKEGCLELVSRCVIGGAGQRSICGYWISDERRGQERYSHSQTPHGVSLCVCVCDLLCMVL